MSIFKFKHFQVQQEASAMKIGTDAMIFGALIESEGKKIALDIGCGTGVLSLMVAQQNASIKILAVEIDPNAANEAQENFYSSPFKTQLSVSCIDFLIFKPQQSFDLIFSNPPYFENSSNSPFQNRNAARHDDGLPLHLLFSQVNKMLSPVGHFWVILPHLTMEQYEAVAQKHGLFPAKMFFIYGKTNQLVRKIVAFTRIQMVCESHSITIRNDDNTYSTAYKNLTFEFHFNKLK